MCSYLKLNNLTKMTLSFGDIPQELQEMRKNIKDNTIKKLYSNFNFHYLSSSTNETIDYNSIKTYLFQYLNEFKFLTYQMSKSIEKESGLINKTKLIICVENQCLIIDSVNSDLILEIINNLEISKIDISPETNENSKTKEELAAYEEVTNFCSHFQTHIKKNLFVKSTIFPIVSFIIRRFYYPTNFFKDQTFFIFDTKENTIEQNFQTNFENIISSKNNDEYKINFPKFANFIHDEKNLQKLCNSNKNDYKFQEKDFIVLRNIHSKKNLIQLVIHINKFYLFVIKTINQSYGSLHLQQHEIDFCEKFSHRCLTKFYGFIKEKDYISFVYEFMSNGQLSQFIFKNKEKINNLYSFISLNRIFQGINYMHSNSIIYRDLKPSNILIDHDYKVFIADFDCVKNIEKSGEFTNDIGSTQYMSPEQYNGEKLDFSSDIFSFGLIIYLLFEKKDLNSPLTNFCITKNLPTITNAPKQIQNLFLECIKVNPKERITKKFILKNLFTQMKSFEYLEDFLSNENEQKKLIPLVIRYFIENIICLYQNKKIIKIKIHTFYIYKFLDIFIQENNSQTINKLGLLYEMGIIVENDYLKAKKYYELAIEKDNNPHAIVRLGFLYEKGKGVEQNQSIAYDYYKLAAQRDFWFGFYLQGKCHILGKGVEKDIEKGKHFFKLVEEFDDNDSYYNLGMLYYDGKLVEKDYEKAKYFFELLAKRNEPNGLLMLGNMYKEGNGFTQNYNEALNCFKLSIKNGSTAGYHNIGNYYYQIKKDVSKAKYYYELASQNYSYNTSYMLALIYYQHTNDVLKFKEYIKLAIIGDHTPSYHLYGIY